MTALDKIEDLILQLQMCKADAREYEKTIVQHIILECCEVYHNESVRFIAGKHDGISIDVIWSVNMTNSPESYADAMTRRISEITGRNVYRYGNVIYEPATAKFRAQYGIVIDAEEPEETEEID